MDGRDGTQEHQMTANACERSLVSWRACMQQCYGTCMLQKGCVHTRKDWKEQQEGYGAAREREGTSRDLCP